MKRESFKSRLGFLLVSAGCAIGIGNVWRFPYVAGQNGGGIFVLFYLIFLVAMGLPVLTMELAVGRASRNSAVLGYKTLEKEGSKWHIHGWIAMFGCYMLMMYYTTVSGWMVSYFFKFLKGEFQTGMTADNTAAVFSNLLADPGQMAFWMILTVILGFFVCSRGLQNGLEKNKQDHDECAADSDRCSCGAQYYTAGCSRRREVLSCPESGHGCRDRA